MIIASHPKSGYFSQFIYTTDISKKGNGLDVYLKGNCNSKSSEGFVCADCYEQELDHMVSLNSGVLKLKKFVAYQLELYENSEIWLKEFRMWVKHGPYIEDYLENIINDVLDDLVKVEFNQSDISPLLHITNNFTGATIHQINNGGVNSLVINYITTLDNMASSGVPAEIIEEGREILKDADKSDSLKKIAGNWIKNLPFKMIEKAGEWTSSNTESLKQYYDELINWFNTL